MSKRIIHIILLCCLALPAMAQADVTYMTSNVERIAEMLPSLRLDTLSVGDTSVEYRGIPLTIRKGDNGQIEHIGVRVFAESMRDAYHLPVYDFVEQTCLKHRLEPDSGDASYDDMGFVIGSWASLDSIGTDTDVDIRRTGRDRYVITWSRQDEAVARVAVPVEYDVFLSVGRQELEQIYLRDLPSYKVPELTAMPVVTPRDSIADTSRPGIVVRKGECYTDASINQNTYLVKADGGQYRMLYSPEHPVETLVNIINGAAYVYSGKSLNIKFNLYGNRKEYLTVPLQQLLAYAVSRHETPFLGIERADADVIEMSLFLDNPEAGYSHVLFVSCAPATVTDPSAPIQAEAYLYSPKH